MNDQLPTWMLPTWLVSRNVISSQELLDGATHSRLQDGLQINLSGQDHHPASHSQLQETEKDKMTSATSGLTSSNLSESVNLQQYLESKLQQQLKQSGSTIYKLIWKHKVTPRGWSYYQLAASAPRTKENDCFSWPTPNQRDYKDGAAPSVVNSGRTDKLAHAVHNIVGWPTPVVSESTHSYGGWNRDGSRKIILKLTGTAKLLNARMESTAPSQLNPRFSLWLMGFPIEWAYCGEQVMPLSRRSQQKS